MRITSCQEQYRSALKFGAQNWKIWEYTSGRILRMESRWCIEKFTSWAITRRVTSDGCIYLWCSSRWNNNLSSVCVKDYWIDGDTVLWWAPWVEHRKCGRGTAFWYYTTHECTHSIMSCLFIICVVLSRTSRLGTWKYLLKEFAVHILEKDSCRNWLFLDKLFLKFVNNKPGRQHHSLHFLWHFRSQRPRSVHHFQKPTLVCSANISWDQRSISRYRKMRIEDVTLRIS